MTDGMTDGKETNSMFSSCLLLLCLLYLLLSVYLSWRSKSPLLRWGSILCKQTRVKAKEGLVSHAGSWSCCGRAGGAAKSRLKSELLRR